MTISDADLQHYHDQGYLIRRQVFTAARMTSLRDAMERLMDRALAGEVEIGWIDREQRLLQRTGQLFAPEKYDAAYAAWLNDDLDTHLRALLDAAPRHSLFGMLASGGGQPYQQAWHRDLGRPGDDDEETFYHRHHGKYVQFNAPLLPGDRFLHIVPASHLRASTVQEIEAAAAGEEADMPDALVVELEPGDIVYYDANLWHRGWNPAGVNRWSMHCAFWRADCPVMTHEINQRDALLSVGHLDRIPPIAREYVQRYLDNIPAEPLRLQDL